MTRVKSHNKVVNAEQVLEQQDTSLLVANASPSTYMTYYVVRS